MKIIRTLFSSFLFFCPSLLFSQSPGKIVRPAMGPYSTVLNPNQNGYSSSGTSGFSSNDISGSEIKFKIVPPAVTEPTGDLATGPSGGFTDIVKTVDNSGFYVYVDAANNLLFRLRIGGIISGSKGYSVLIDTDNKMGNTGSSADPNFKAPTNTSNGNPGFEYEVVLQTNFQVAVYNVDGITNPVSPVATYPLSSNSQISVALSTDGNNPDYFYDWYVPLSAIGSPASIRMSATTVTSPSSALQGSRSDIYGIDDAAHSSVANAWTSVVNAQPAISMASISGTGTGVGTVCTAPPSVNTPITLGSSIPVTGTWTRMDPSKPDSATISLFKNGSSVGTYSVKTGETWSITVPTISVGDVFYAKAQAKGESQCLESDRVTAGCTSYPAAPVLNQSSSKGMCGTMPAGATVSIYQFTSTGALTLMNANGANTTYGATTFNYFSCSGGSGNVPSGTYMIVASLNGCTPTPIFDCISNGSSSLSGLTTNALTLPVMYPFQTSVTGSGATSGSILRLFVNNMQVAFMTATGSSFTFSNLSLKTGDQLKIYAQPATGCVTVSNMFTVSCYNQPPVITTDASGKLLSSATSISGTAASNASITLNRTSPTASSWTTTANANGAWAVSGLTLSSGDVFTATVTSTAGCSTASAASASATVVAPTTVCPVITSNPAETHSSVSGTITTSSTGVVRLYLDDALEGSFNVTTTGTTTWNISSLPYVLYNGGVLKATFQAGTNAESTGCGLVTVSCTSPALPVIQSITPGTTITAGQNISLALSNIAANTWYAVMDNAGKSYASTIYTGSNSNLSLPTTSFSAPGTYNLKITADKLTGCPASFATTAIMVNAAALPVTFLGLNARQSANGTFLTWLVSNEMNVLRYEVERSADCRNFSVIASLNYQPSAAAVNSYSFQDNGTIGKSCYRIKQVDVDGHFHYSSTLQVGGNQKSELQVSPNPTHDYITLTKMSLSNESVVVYLLDMNGKIVYQKGWAVLPGKNNCTIQQLGKLCRGQYIVKLATATGSEFQKILLQ